MRVSINLAFICVIVVAAVSIPALGMSNGPGAYNSNDELTVKYGCSCHNNGAPSERAVVMVTGGPLMYEQSESYQLTIRVADSLTLSGGEGNTQAGFLLSCFASLEGIACLILKTPCRMCIWRFDQQPTNLASFSALLRFYGH